MAEIIENEGGKKKGKRRAKKHPAHIDMTPMVDLACLLVTFFMLTTAFNKPKVMEIVLPEKKKDVKAPEVNKSRVVTIILSAKDDVFYYFGLADPTTGSLPTMIKSNYGKDGIRKMLLTRNKSLFESVYYYNDSVTRGLGKYKVNMSADSLKRAIRNMGHADLNSPIVLIKAAEGATYGNLVDVIDEIAITSVPHYAVVDMNYVENKMLKDALAGKNVEVQQ
jgi:biopolymer transport protein ExbD